MKGLLKLYIIGHTPASIRALENLKSICDNELKDLFEYRIIDILKEPAIAEKDKILATPALLKEIPPPSRLVIGDLSDKKSVLLSLDILVS